MYSQSLETGRFAMHFSGMLPNRFPVDSRAERMSNLLFVRFGKKLWPTRGIEIKWEEDRRERRPKMAIESRTIAG